MPVTRIAVCVLVFSLAIAGLAAASSPPIEEWNVTFAGRYSEDNANIGYSIRHTTDGNYIIAGVMGRTSGTSDIWLMKLDPSGTVIWEQVFGTTATDDRAYDVALTGDGGYILCGDTTNLNTPNQDAILIRTDSGGREVWRKTYSSGTVNYASSIKTTADGGYVFTGASDDRAWVVKLDGTGILRWENVYDTELRASDVVQSSDGGFIITSLRKVDGFYLVRKLDSTGLGIWDTRLNQRLVSAPLREAMLSPASDGGYVVTANNAMNDLLYPYLVKFDERGGIVWEKQVGTDPQEDIATRFAPTSDGGYVLICSGICKTDVGGNTEWVLNETSGVPWSIQQADDGGYMLTGYKNRGTRADLWVAKLSGTTPVTPQVPTVQEVTTMKPGMTSPVPSTLAQATTSTRVESGTSPATAPQTLPPGSSQTSPSPGSPPSPFTLLLGLIILMLMRKGRQG